MNRLRNEMRKKAVTTFSQYLLERVWQVCTAEQIVVRDICKEGQTERLALILPIQ